MKIIKEQDLNEEFLLRQCEKTKRYKFNGKAPKLISGNEENLLM